MVASLGGKPRFQGIEVKTDEEIVKEKHIMGIPRSTTVLYETDTIIVFGRTKDIKKFIEINQ